METVITDNKTKDRVFILKRKKHGTSSSTIPGECLYIDDKGNQRVLRYVPGSPKMFKDEQSELDQERRAESIKFRNGLCVVPSYDKQKIKYLEMCSYNEDNKAKKGDHNTLFYEHRPEINSAKELEKEKAIAEMSGRVFAMSPDEVQAVYLSMFAKSNNGIDYNYVQRQDTNTLRMSLLSKAKTAPEDFAAAMKSSANANVYYIFKAAELGIISINREANTIKFTGGDNFVNSVGQDVVHYFAERATENDHLMAIMEQIKTRVNPNKAQDAAHDAKVRQERSAHTFEYTTDEDYTLLINQLVEKKYIDVSDNNVWHTVYLPNQEEPEKIKSIKGVIQRIKDDPAFREALIRMNKD